jgi:hypothetical protein
LIFGARQRGAPVTCNVRPHASTRTHLRPPAFAVRRVTWRLLSSTVFFRANPYRRSHRWPLQARFRTRRRCPAVLPHSHSTARPGYFMPSRTSVAGAPCLCPSHHLFSTAGPAWFQPQLPISLQWHRHFAGCAPHDGIRRLPPLAMPRYRRARPSSRLVAICSVPSVITVLLPTAFGLTFRSTGPAGTCLDLRSASRRRAGYLQR